MDNTVIKIENLTKIYKLYENPIDRLKESLSISKKIYYKEHYALNDVSLEINEGDTVGIIGTNGSGKSTLLKIITGVLNPTMGNVQVKGRVSALLELGAGFNPEYTGIQNIYLNGSILGYSEKEIDEKLQSILDFADIGEFIHQPVKTYSSGMFARLAFSVAVNIEPDILIVDEALAVGDSRFQQKSIRKMKSLMKKSKAILFVSHDTTSIRNLCSKTIWIMDGKVFKYGETKQITRMYDDYVAHGVFTDTTIEQTNTTKDDVKEVSYKDLNAADKFELQNIDKGNHVGGEKAKFKQVAFYKKGELGKISVVSKETKTFFIAYLEVYEDIVDPLFGIGIFNEKGLPIIHFNNYALGKKLGTLRKGQKLYLRFDMTIPNLRNGEYFISMGLDEGEFGEHTVVHRVNECYSFKMYRDDKYSKEHGQIIVEDVDIDIMSM